MITLVALLAMTTGAWAQGKLIYEKDFSSDASYPFYLDAADKTGASATVTDGLLVLNNPKVQSTNWDVQPEIGRLTSAAPTTQGNTYRVVMQYKTTVAGSVTFALGAQDWNNTDWSGQTITVSNDFQTCEAYFNSFPYSNSESHILLQFGELVGTITIKKVEVYELYPFDGISWNASTKTATIAEMPAGNVFVVPEYYPQAVLATGGAPTAINDVPATTDGAIVEAGTVANITGTTTAQGTVMYYAVQSATAPTAPDYDATGWTDKVPTATDFAEGNVYVWYYVKGAEPASVADRTDANTCSDSEITALGTTGYVTLLAAPKYNAEFAFDEGTPDAEKAKWGTNIPDGGVVKGTAVTVTYTGTKKVIGVKAEKKAAGPLAAAFKDGAKFKVGYQWNGGLTTYLEFTNSGGTYSLTSVSGANELNGFNSSTLTVKNGNVLALDVVCHPEGDSKIDEFSAQIEFDATSSTYKYSSKGGYFDGIISVSVNDADITSQLTPAN